MKPIFIYENENCTTITISRERFEKLINEAYENGRKDSHAPVIATRGITAYDHPSNFIGEAPVEVDYAKASKTTIGYADLDYTLSEKNT